MLKAYLRSGVLLMVFLAFSGCSKNKQQEEIPLEEKLQHKIQNQENLANGKVIDMRSMGSEMIYGMFFQFLISPEDYVGTRIIVKGLFYYSDNPYTKKCESILIVKDALACCKQGIGFELADTNLLCPDDFPPMGTEIIVDGIFNMYTTEEGVEMIQLKNCTMETVKD